MKRDHLLLFATFMLVSVLAGCCFEHREIHYQIPPNAYSLIPYDTGSTFRMVDTAGTITTFEYVSASLEDISRGSCRECCEENFGQQFRFTMRGGSPFVTMEFGLVQDGWGGQSVHDPTIFQLTFNDFSRFSWTRYLTEQESECSDDPNSGVNCLFNFEVAGVTYDTLYQFTRPEFLQGFTQDAEVSAMWYSTEAGLVKYMTFGGNAWELLP